MNRPRTVRFTDNLWEAMAASADAHDRPIGEEIRLACEAWLGESFEDERIVRTTVVGYRQSVREEEERAA